MSLTMSLQTPKREVATLKKLQAQMREDVRRTRTQGFAEFYCARCETTPHSRLPCDGAMGLCVAVAHDPARRRFHRLAVHVQELQH